MFGGPSRVRERRRSRPVILSMEVITYNHVYSTILEHMHSQIVVDDGIKHTYKKTRRKIEILEQTCTTCTTFNTYDTCNTCTTCTT